MKTKSVNHYEVTARLTADSEIRNDGNVIKMRLCHNIGSTPLYLSATVFMNKGKASEKKNIPVEKLKKGNILLFAGSLRPNNWTDKEGRNRYDYDFIVSRISEPELVEDSATAEDEAEAKNAEEQEA